MHKTAYISCRAYPELKNWLSDRGYELNVLHEGDKPYPAISSHPDIYMCHTGKKLLKQSDIGSKFPDYLGFNGVFLDKYFIHNLDYSSPALLKEAEGLELINVKQGYAKCSCVVVDEKSIITADEGIVKKIQNYDIDVLKVSQGHVLLDGFDYGFIGGASGRVGNCIVFNGDLNTHLDGKAIRGFITSRGLEVVDFKGHDLCDIGTVFTEEF